ncbi:GTPase-activating protein gyp1 [Grifola frondosa]|uniref:GTPase-activating protein gyp1 n=1 Tax=Grifola frondosa TaxID=5627 RepID=A0A1C7M7N0_GRIFR|nr:GTPase-activating protein gyp1 [Grifola frondosa]
MPPAKSKPTKSVLSSARDLVTVGPRDVTAKSQSGRDATRQRQLTDRALVLRNGKYGARGTGELMAMGKMSGREKLELLADRTKTAVGVPFRLEICMKIADSQLSAGLDEISDLQDHEMFYDRIVAEIRARNPSVPGRNAADPLRDANKVASIVASRLVGDTLRDLGDDGLEDSTVRRQLEGDASMRSRYLVLYDIVNVLAEAVQTKFALLATTAPHYAQYFRKNELTAQDQPEYIFDWGGLKQIHKSFLDSIIVELCLPQSGIPRHILCQILGEAIEECPRDAKRFSQEVWNAVGDCATPGNSRKSFTVPQGQEWKEVPREMPEEFEDWNDEQILSEEASKSYANFKQVIYPLDRTRKKNVLDDMWKIVNQNYEAVCGQDIDNLWQLSDIRQLGPQWHARYIEGSSLNADDQSALVPVKGKNKGSTSGRPAGKLLAIRNGDESDDSMPSLRSVSDYSDGEDDESSYFDSEEDKDDDSDEDEAESEYDTDEEDTMRDLLREAMDAAMASPDFFDPSSAAPDFDALAEERRGNPFLKLLGSLRGRMFSSNPNLKTTSRTVPRHPPTTTTKKPLPAKPRLVPVIPRKAPAPGTPIPKSHKTTVEAVEDEDEIAAAAKKKKKKPKKKKKKPSVSEADGPTLNSQISPEIPSTPQPAPEAPVQNQTTPATPLAKKGSNNVPQSPSKPKAATESLRSVQSTSAPSWASTTSLPLPQTAQSAHKYVQSEGLDKASKTKVKSRPGHATLVAIPEKRSIFSKFSKKTRDQAEEEPKEKGNKHSFFSRLTKKTTTYMHQLLHTSADETKGLAPMKWENFLKVMREMGFTYEPGTAGSSVRFDPPDPRDVSIMFHKPHPDPTIHPVMLKDFAKKLKRTYGWSEEDFYKASQSMAARPPPARPHIGLNPSTRFSSYSTNEWAEDDAWDSASDSESQGPSEWKRSSNARPSTSTTAPKPVPRPALNNSSTTLAFSYTHVHAPSPSSYSPRLDHPSKNGWTIVRKSVDRHSMEGHDTAKPVDAPVYEDVEGDMVVGDFEPEVEEQRAILTGKPRHEHGILREDVDEIVNDPLYLVRHRATKRSSRSQPAGDMLDSDVQEKLIREQSIRTNRWKKFIDCITQEDVNMAQLRKLAWNGVPSDLRPIVWPLLLGYLPLPTPLRSSTLARKRQEYASLVELAFSRNRDGPDQQVWHQIEIDVPRTRPGVRLWMQTCTQRVGVPVDMNTLAVDQRASEFRTDIVFLSAYIGALFAFVLVKLILTVPSTEDSDPEDFDTALLPENVLSAVEADTFWCLSRLLDGIQDNYIATQPGIQRSVKRMAELVARIDAPLAAHLEKENVEFMQFAFRWMNCLLMREITVQNTIRMWDTYLAEGPDAFSQFHLYVCSAFLVRWSKKLQEMDFQGIIMFLQSLPTQGWSDNEIEMLLSEAFVHYSTWHNAQSHFAGK